MKDSRRALARNLATLSENAARREEECRWRRLFDDPSVWRDNRSNKCSPCYPDFVHAFTGESLWINSSSCPSWIQDKLKTLKHPNPIEVQNKDARTNGTDQNISGFLSALKVCSNSRDLRKGMEIHARVVESGNISITYLANAVISMYARCGSMVEARRVFDGMHLRDTVSWTALITGYVYSGQCELALQFFERMKKEGWTPTGRTYVVALKACASLALKEERKHFDQAVWKSMCLEKGTAIHMELGKAGLESDIFVACTLIDMYAKCGSMLEAQRVFDRMQHRNVVVWTALILGYAQNEEGELALRLFARMQAGGITPGAHTYVAALKACTSLVELKQLDEKAKLELQKTILEKGVEIHSQLAGNGHENNVIVMSSLLDMYAKCGCMVKARDLFDRMLQRDVVSWNTIIMGYAQSGEEELALRLFFQMQDEGYRPNARTFIAALYACGSFAVKEEAEQVDGRLMKLGCLEKGIAIHSQLKQSGHELEIFVASTLVDMYVKCGSMEDARQVFARMPHHDAVSWTAIISGYSQNGEGEFALEYFARMQEEGFDPLPKTFIAALRACSCLASQEGTEEQTRTQYLQKGRDIHSQIRKFGYEVDVFVASSLVDMYAKCGSMGEALYIFDKMQYHDVVSWNSVIMGSVLSGDGELALRLFFRMREEGCIPNAVTYVAALKACSSLVAVEAGKRFHLEIRQAGFEREMFVANSLIGFYGRIGSMSDAQQVFDSAEIKDSVTWTALITGYSHRGDTSQAFDLFERMQNERLQPDGITFLCILTLCSHAGLVDKGKQYFQAMCSDYMIPPNIEHYACMVDLLSRANHLEDALAMVKSMPYEPSSKVWMAVLSACRKWRNVAVAKVAFESLMKLGHADSSAYVLMSNTYVAAGMLEEGGRIKAALTSMTVKTGDNGCWIDSPRRFPDSDRTPATKSAEFLEKEATEEVA